MSRVRKGNEPTTPEEQMLDEAASLYAEKLNDADAHKLQSRADHIGMFGLDQAVADDPIHLQNMEKINDKYEMDEVADINNDDDQKFRGRLLKFLMREG